MYKAASKLILALMLGLGVAASGWATIIPVEEAVEAVALDLRLNDDGTGTVSGGSCDACERKRFPVTLQTQAFENNVRVDIRRALEQRGQPATIIYNLRSGEATKIMWSR